MKNKIIFLILLVATKIFSNEVYLDIYKHKSRQKNFLYNKFESNKIIITKEEIGSYDKSSLLDVLRYYGVETKVRSGAQGEIILFGGTFQQVSLMINGVNVSDAHTAHHNFNVPISIKDIEQIEIITDGQTGLSGRNAFVGSVNIITKKLVPKTEVKFSYGTNEMLDFYLVKGFDTNFFSIQHTKSDGHRENTDYSLFNIFYTKSLDYKKIKLDITTGFLDKNFGAQDFYAIGRKEYEKTKTGLLILNSNYKLKKIEFVGEIFFRSNNDYYTTQRYQPQMYYNNHQSYFYGLNIKSIIDNFSGYKFVFGIDNRYDELDSKGGSTIFSWSGMGNFYDFHSGIYTQVTKSYDKISLMVNLRNDFYTRFGQQFSFGIDFEHKMFDNFKHIFMVKKVHRIPSYTELYYWDPQNTASLELKTEHTDIYSYELKYLYKFLLFSAKGFKYENSNLIDWTKNINSTVWKVDNISKSNTEGLETSMVFIGEAKPIVRIYTNLLNKKISIPDGKELKYAANWPNKNFGIIYYLPRLYGIETNISCVYKEMTKTNPKEFFLTDIFISKKISNLTVFSSLKNIFDIEYEELQNIKQPGREIIFGIEFLF